MGKQLPVEMLKVLFPVAYWDLIKRHSNAHGLDPYVIAALMAQESTFDPPIKSHANAVGLMQMSAVDRVAATRSASACGASGRRC